MLNFQLRNFNSNFHFQRIGITNVNKSNRPKRHTKTRPGQLCAENSWAANWQSSEGYLNS